MKKSPLCHFSGQEVTYIERNRVKKITTGVLEKNGPGVRMELRTERVKAHLNIF